MNTRGKELECDCKYNDRSVPEWE